jgi:hypothetical protein
MADEFRPKLEVDISTSRAIPVDFVSFEFIGSRASGERTPSWLLRQPKHYPIITTIFLLKLRRNKK